MYSFDINLPVTPLKDGINEFELFHERFKNDIKLQKLGLFNVSSDIVNPYLVEILRERGLRFTKIDALYTPLNYSTFVHVDWQLGKDFTKINWIYGGEGSYMTYYETLGDTKFKFRQTAPATTKTPPGYWRLDDSCTVTPICTEVIKFPSILQVGVPHNVTNLSDHRFCLSVNYDYDLRNSNLKVKPTLGQMVDLFGDMRV